METKLNVFASSIQIDVLVVIDTDLVKAQNQPSQDQNNPTSIGHNYAYMICNDPRGINSGQGTGDLSFRAFPGDSVNFRGTSIYQNSDDAVIVYACIKFDGTQVFNPFQAIQVRRDGAAVPTTGVAGGNGLPAQNIPINFQALNTTVGNSGTEQFVVRFALYTCSDGETQKLYGYYQWDPTCTVA
jgi:nematocidal protein AidA